MKSFCFNRGALRFVSSLFAVFLVLSAGQSCLKSDFSIQAVCEEGEMSSFAFSTFTEGYEGDNAREEVSTRSRLTGSGIETDKSCISLGAYSDGQLVSCSHYTSGLTAMQLDLISGRTYNVYALVNMDDMTSSFPVSESNISSVSYTIPSYSSVQSLGIPMSGRVIGVSVSSSTTGTLYIPVKRLFAKVTANLNCLWGGTITNAYVKGLNKSIYPFGTSSAGSLDELSDYEIALVSGSNNSSNLQAVFYVPENISGTLDSVTSSRNKNRDNNTVDMFLHSKTASYLEVSVSGSGDYSGMVTYRSYLGNNSTSDFNIERNTRYIWDISYSEDGLQYDDWKVDNDLTGERYVFVLEDDYANEISSISIGVGQNLKYYIYRYQETFSSGSWLRSASSRTLVPFLSGSTYYYTFNGSTASTSLYGEDSNGSNALIATIWGQSNNMRCRGDKLGTTSCILSINDVRVGATGTLVVPVYVGDAETFAIPTTNYTLYVGESVSVSPVLNRYVNGVFQGTVSGATFIYDDHGNSYVSLSSGGVATGLAATNYTTIPIEASYNGKYYYGYVGFTVMNSDITYTYEDLVVRPANSMIYVGETETYTATCTRKSWQNGSVIATDNNFEVTSLCTWSSDNTSIATMSGNIATGRADGSTTVTATYEGMSASASLIVMNSDITYTYEDLVVRPANSMIYVGETETYTATCTRKSWQNGSVIATDNFEVTSLCTWNSSNAGIASMSDNVATGLSEGIVTVIAEFAGLSASAMLTVEQAPALTRDYYYLTLSISGPDSNYPNEYYVGEISNVATVQLWKKTQVYVDDGFGTYVWSDYVDSNTLVKTLTTSEYTINISNSTVASYLGNGRIRADYAGTSRDGMTTSLYAVYTASAYTNPDSLSIRSAAQSIHVSREAGGSD